jgi:hypothetical protein
MCVCVCVCVCVRVLMRDAEHTDRMDLLHEESLEGVKHLLYDFRPLALLGHYAAYSGNSLPTFRPTDTDGLLRDVDEELALHAEKCPGRTRVERLVVCRLFCLFIRSFVYLVWRLTEVSSPKEGFKKSVFTFTWLRIIPIL